MRSTRHLSLALVLGISSLALVACEPPQKAKTPLSYAEDAKHAYEKALVAFDARDWLDAQALLREVKRKYGYSKYARLAELRLADIDFEEERYAEATRAYKQFIHDHHSDTAEVAFASARIAEGQYRQISDSIILPTSEERDQATTQDAYRELRAFLREHPEAKESAHVCDLLEDVTQRLVRHELYVARFYMARDNYDASVLRIQFALRNYSQRLTCKGTLAFSEYGGIPEALLLLGEVYLRMDKRDDAKRAFSAVVETYPDSGVATEADKYLKRLARS